MPFKHTVTRPRLGLRHHCRAAVTLTLGLSWLVACFALFLPVAILKLLIRTPGAYLIFTRRLDAIVGLFSAGLGKLLDWMQVGGYELELTGELRRDRSYLLISNHVSWVDIVYLLVLHHGRIPFPRFFLKRTLLWVPIIGFACWALDFPFMRRYSSKARRKNPSLAKRDLDTARKACERYRQTPVTIINYVEGTRWSARRHVHQASPWPYLLRPRAGGVSYVIATMGDQLAGVIDTTLVYPSTQGPGFWRFLSGAEQPVIVRMQLRPVPEQVLNAPAGQVGAPTRHWINGLWDEKNALIDEIRGNASH